MLPFPKDRKCVDCGRGYTVLTRGGPDAEHTMCDPECSPTQSSSGDQESEEPAQE